MMMMMMMMMMMIDWATVESNSRLYSKGRYKCDSRKEARGCRRPHYNHRNHKQTPNNNKSIRQKDG